MSDFYDYAAWRSWDVWNVALLVFFSLELVLRLACYQKPLRDMMMWIDALCIVPLILRVAVSFSPAYFLTGDLIELYLHNKARCQTR